NSRCRHQPIGRVVGFHEHLPCYRLEVFRRAAHLGVPGVPGGVRTIPPPGGRVGGMVVAVTRGAPQCCAAGGPFRPIPPHDFGGMLPGRPWPHWGTLAETISGRLPYWAIHSFPTRV